ncbi:MAG TPA: hypothetical protein VK989_15720, partial [Polyangia bacterium]|nr:hypothetical protein [Polyangia bacterium]
MPTSLRALVFLPALLAGTIVTSWASFALAAPAGASPRRPSSGDKGPALPVEESLSERRAVRGSAVDDASA